MPIQEPDMRSMFGTENHKNIDNACAARFTSALETVYRRLYRVPRIVSESILYERESDKAIV